MPTALDLCPLSLAINSQLHIIGWGEPVTIRQRKKKQREKRKKRKERVEVDTIQVFFSFSSQE